MQLKRFIINSATLAALLIGSLPTVTWTPLTPVNAQGLQAALKAKAPAAPAADWTAWTQQAQMAIRNNASTAMPGGYTVQLTLDTTGLVQQSQLRNDCADLRISWLNAGNDVELDRMVERCDSASTAVTFRTQASIGIGALDTSYRLHYGNPAPGAPPVNAANIYAYVEDFQSGAANGWVTKGTWGIVTEGSNNFYRYTSGGAAWASAFQPLAGVSDLDYSARLRATNSPMTNWIGLAFREQDQNNFLTFYVSRDGGVFKYARVQSDNHTIVNPTPTFNMAADTWYWMRVQAVGTTVRARIWPDGATEPATWLYSGADTTFQTMSHVGFTLYNHPTNADWDDVKVRRLADVEPTVAIVSDVAPWWASAWTYRAGIAITNTSTTDSLRVGYSVHTVIDTSGLITLGRLKADCTDLRVVSFNGFSNSELDRVVENCNSAQTDLWFALPRPLAPGARDEGYFVYYGNAVAGAPPADASRVFIFYEDWENGTDHWTGAAGMDATNSGIMGYSVITDVEYVSPNHSQVFPVKASGGDAFSGFIPVQPGTTYAIDASAKSATGAYLPVGVNPYDSAHNVGSEIWAWTNEWTVSPQWTQHSARFTTPANAAYLKIKTEWWSQGPGSAPVYLDNLILRYGANVEPTLVLGAEETTLPTPAITSITDNAAVELGTPLVVTAQVSATAANDDVISVTLRVSAPETADVPMMRVSGDAQNGAWRASFTPAQGGTYAYRVLATSNLGRTKLSALHTAQVNDTQPPQITPVSVIDPISYKATQTLTVNVTDNGRISAVTLSTISRTYTMAQHGALYDHAWQITSLGTLTYSVTATDTGGNHSTLSGSFVAQPLNVDVCTWKDCKKGAATWSNDDGNNACFAELQTAGFRGTYYYNGNTTQDWFATYSAAGHEIGTHTVSHPCNGGCCSTPCTADSLGQCPIDPVEVTRYRQVELEPNIAAIEAGTGKPVVTGAWPCGCTDPTRMTAASNYFVGVRGYNDCGCTWVQDVNQPTPVNFMNLNGLHAYDQTFIDRAANEGTWTIVTSHGSCEGISYMGSRKDVLWLAPVGEVLKYIKVRDAAQFSNYARAGRTISFDAVHTLATFQRQKVDGAAMTPILWDNPVTLKVHLEDADTVQGVQANGAPVSYTVQTVDGGRFVLFDTPLFTAQHVVVSLAGPAPVIAQVSSNSPVELGTAAQFRAVVHIAEGSVQSVVLHVLTPVATDYAMTPVSGMVDTYEASFTPWQIATYTYRVVAANAEGATVQSALNNLTVRDTQPPQWTAATQAHDRINTGGSNTLSAQGRDVGALKWAMLATDESGAWQDFDWPNANWWDHRWTHRRAVTLNETAGRARSSELIDLALSSAELPGVTDCAAQLRVTDDARHEVIAQVYGQDTVNGVLSCHLLFPASVGANASRTYYLYYGNPSATAPVYSSDLSSSSAGTRLTVRNNYFDLDLDSSGSGGIVTRVRLPQGSNVDLPLSPQSDMYWGWHQVCSSADGNITGKNSLCIGSALPATGVEMVTTVDGPLLKEYTFRSVKSSTTYAITYRFFSGMPYYQYSLARVGSTATVMNNFWYTRGNYGRLGVGTTTAPATVYNLYNSGADQVRMASFATVDYTSIDGADNSGSDLGGPDYRYPTASGLALYVTTGATQQATQDVLAQVTAPIGSALGAAEDDVPGSYGSPLDLNGATDWASASFTWRNPAIPDGRTIHWRIKFCDQTGNCGTTDPLSFEVGEQTPPPVLPSSFYGEVQVLGAAQPQAGDIVQVRVAGVITAFQTPIVISQPITYTIDVPGDVQGTLAKEGGAEGDVLTFTWGSRIMATAIWHSGTNTALHLHPPLAALSVAGTPLAGAPVTLDAGASQDAGSDITTYAFDCTHDGTFEITQATPQAACSYATTGNYTAAVKVTDAQGGEDVTTVSVNVTLAEHRVSLQPGWNLVSFRLHPTATDIATLLSSLGTTYDLVYAWSGGVWHKYDRLAGFGNDLSTLDEKQGWWIHVTAGTATELVVRGTEAAGTDIPLAAGWNLVGYPASVNRALPGALSGQGVTLVYAYHAVDTADPWKLYDYGQGGGMGNDLLELTPGWGYWVQATTATTWHVSNTAP
jgi:peptidoglycan/xylan/chitin deacetylase (PgdA/CDA1 family)